MGLKDKDLELLGDWRESCGCYPREKTWLSKSMSVYTGACSTLAAMVECDEVDIAR